MPTDAVQPAEHVPQMAPEYAAIGVKLVENDVAKILEKLRPARVMRQDSRVQHVGIAEHDVRAGADGAGGCPSAACRDC